MAHVFTFYSPPPYHCTNQQVSFCYVPKIKCLVWHTYPCVECQFITCLEYIRTFSFPWIALRIQLHLRWEVNLHHHGDRYWTCIIIYRMSSFSNTPWKLQECNANCRKYYISCLLRIRIVCLIQFLLCGISTHHLWGMQITCMKFTSLRGILIIHLWGM